MNVQTRISNFELDGDSLVAFLRARTMPFVEACKDETGGYRLTKASESSPYSRCFAIFHLHLLGRLSDIESEFSSLAFDIENDLRRFEQHRKLIVGLTTDKNYLQLFAFSLSALYLLNALQEHPLDDLVESVIPSDMTNYLISVKAFDGVPRSGNLAMCMAVLAIYGRDYLGMGTQKQIDNWVEGHLSHMNQFGYWGNDKITHLQFQNGFHQYEILEYLDIANPKLQNAVDLLHNICDKRGHFAPYPGGSGCYDYDAINIITAPAYCLLERDVALLNKTKFAVMETQNADGGFCESKWVRPLTPAALSEGLSHVFASRGALFKERLRLFLAFYSPKNNRIHTHWTKYSRHWYESNIWDTWLRSLTLARIDCAINTENLGNWGFMNFPGMGYHKGMGVK